MLSANSYLLLSTEVLGIKTFLIDHPLPSYPLHLYCIAKYQSARNSRLRIYHTNQFNTRLYITVKHDNIIYPLQDELILSGDAVIHIPK